MFGVIVENPRVVWNGSKDRAMLKFVNGEYTTDVEKEIIRLQDYPTRPPNAVAKYFEAEKIKKEKPKPKPKPKK